MPECPPPDPKEFGRQFRRKYGRDMTPDETKFYQLTKDLLENPPEEEGGGEGEAA
jgi:hypothetical protein